MLQTHRTTQQRKMIAKFIAKFALTSPKDLQKRTGIGPHHEPQEPWTDRKQNSSSAPLPQSPPEILIDGSSTTSTSYRYNLQLVRTNTPAARAGLQSPAYPRHQENLEHYKNCRDQQDRVSRKGLQLFPFATPKNSGFSPARKRRILVEIVVVVGLGTRSEAEQHVSSHRSRAERRC